MASPQVPVSGAFGEGNAGFRSLVRKLAASGAPQMQAKLDGAYPARRL
jgi:hypothetical protein